MRISENNSSQPRQYVIYASHNQAGDVFYIGKSSNLKCRMAEHRMRFGKDTQVKVIQSEFVDELPQDAEKRWIRHFRDQGAKLQNSMHNDWRPLRLKHERSCINVRGVSLDLWRMFTERCDELGYYVRGAVEVAVLDWIEKTHSPNYKDRKEERSEDRIRRLKEL